MADPRWVWDEKVRRYRDTQTGRYLAARRVHVLRDRYVDHRSGLMRDFITETVDGVDRTDATAWRGAVRRVETLGWRRIENTLITEYVYGRGGINAMTDADRTRLRNLLREQKRYWNGFMREAYDDPAKMTTRYMTNRANLYHRSSTGLHERGKASAWDVSLPTYPGMQACGPNCFVGDTPVEASVIEKSMRRWYEGRVLRVRTALGGEFTATPNHPIAGEFGWVAAGNLREGDYVLNAAGSQGATLSDPDVEHRVTTIEQVHDALVDASNSFRVPGFVVNFHGEIPDGDVDVVPATGRLSGIANTSRVQRIADDIFPRADLHGAVPELTLSDVSHDLIGEWPTSHGVMGGTRQSQALLIAELAHSDEASVATVSRGDTLLGEPANNCAASDSEVASNGQDRGAATVHVSRLSGAGDMTQGTIVPSDISATPPVATERGIRDADGLGDRADRLTGLVTLDRIVEVEWRDFAGHVYNLQTDTDWYTAGYIIAHNCKCHWTLKETADQVEAVWQLGYADHCDDCTENSRIYNPYRIERVTETGVYT